MGVELGEHLLDRVEIEAVEREIEDAGSHGMERRRDAVIL
jgi:hypothetical protein